MLKKLNLGSGSDILVNHINHDIVDLPNVDVTHDLNIYPWPWGDDSFDEILMIDVLEHLNEIVPAMEELHRILKPGGVVTIRVPYWNHACAYIDPTHKRGFHEQTFHFFDINSDYYKQRGYYTSATFEISDEALIMTPGDPYFRIPKLGIIYVRRSIFKKLLGWFGNHVGNIISDVQVSLKKV
jgi:SAM-dependent methyltransferase